MEPAQLSSVARSVRHKFRDVTSNIENPKIKSKKVQDMERGDDMVEGAFKTLPDAYIKAKLEAAKIEAALKEAKKVGEYAARGAVWVPIHRCAKIYQNRLLTELFPSGATTNF
jgi:hypothetical protein